MPVGRVWLITGASRGLGRALTLSALDAGDTVVATARSTSSLEPLTTQYGRQVLVRALDVRDEDQAQAVVADVVNAVGRIDVVINNAAAGLFGAVEDTPGDEVRSVFETNVFGLLAVTRAALPVLRAQRAGHLVMMSSMGGFSSGAGFGVYAASKFAVEALAEALREEVAAFGIAVSLVEPGVFDTDFGSAAAATNAVVTEYAESADVGQYDDGQPAADPAVLVDGVRWLVDQPTPPLRLPVGDDAFARITTKLDSVRDELDRVPPLTSAPAVSQPAVE